MDLSYPGILFQASLQWWLLSLVLSQGPIYAHVKNPTGHRFRLPPYGQDVLILMLHTPLWLYFCGSGQPLGTSGTNCFALKCFKEWFLKTTSYHLFCLLPLGSVSFEMEATRLFAYSASLNHHACSLSELPFLEMHINIYCLGSAFQLI